MLNLALGILFKVTCGSFFHEKCKNGYVYPFTKSVNGDAIILFFGKRG
jgi:hypothetical protein